jgi:hypothetical protein
MLYFQLAVLGLIIFAIAASKLTTSAIEKARAEGRQQP